MKKIPNLQVFKRDELPSNLFYSKNNRIGKKFLFWFKNYNSNPALDYFFN